MHGRGKVARGAVSTYHGLGPSQGEQCSSGRGRRGEKQGQKLDLLSTEATRLTVLSVLNKERTPSPRPSPQSKQRASGWKKNYPLTNISPSARARKEVSFWLSCHSLLCHKMAPFWFLRLFFFFFPSPSLGQRSHLGNTLPFISSPSIVLETQ